MVVLAPIRPLCFINVETDGLLTVRVTCRVLNDTSAGPTTEISVRHRRPLRLLLVAVCERLRRI